LIFKVFDSCNLLFSRSKINLFPFSETLTPAFKGVYIQKGCMGVGVANPAYVPMIIFDYDKIPMIVIGPIYKQLEIYPEAEPTPKPTPYARFLGVANLAYDRY
jgi:hypothetical protein